MSPAERERFDALVEEAIDSLPPGLRELLDQLPLIVEDRPTKAILKGVEGEPVNDPSELCGLHTGTAFTERSVEHSGDVPGDIRLFREGILEEAGGWKGDDADDRVFEEIWITLLHEIGHQFGLSEDDLERLGYE